MTEQASAPVEPDIAIADELGFQMVRLVTVLGRAKAHFSRTAQHGIERAAYALLAKLVVEGPQRTTALAESVHADTSTVSRQVGALVQHGLVERMADPLDGRACLLAATERGHDAFDQARAERNTQIASLISDWPESDRRTLVRLLDRLNNEIEERKPELANAAGTGTDKGETR